MTRTQSGGAHFVLRAGLASCLVFAGLAAGQSDALALQGGEDPALLPVLIDKRHGGEDRHQLSLMFGTTMVTKYTEGLGVYGTYQYNFTDMLGVEVGGGFFATDETAIMQQIRAQGRRSAAGFVEPYFSDQYAMQWTAMANIVFVPIYGKMSFASEFDPSFDVFLFAGGGVVGARRGLGGFRESTGIPTSFESAVTPAGDFGGGFRFYFTRLIALRLEVRAWLYPELVSSADLSDPAVQLEDDITGGITSVLNFQVGLQFALGGDS